MSGLEKLFHIREMGSTVRQEVLAGITTFATMAYILAVNPAVLSQAGMDFERVFAATAIASAVATLIMGLLANLPFALSAGMGLNAFFSYSVCIGMGYSWQWALSAVFVEGIILLLLTFFNVREAILNCIPASLKKAISAGIGLFIAYIGLRNAGIIVADQSTVSALNQEWFRGTAGLTVLGVAVTGALLVFRVRGALLLGILITTLIGIPLGETTYAGGSYSPAVPYFFSFAFRDIVSSGKSLFDFCVIVFTFLFVDMFDTVGMLIACTDKTGIVREDGTIPRCKQALLADAVGTTVGAVLGTSTITTFVESAAGIAQGARTGLASVVTALLFLLALFFEPVFGSIPTAATAPILIIVGLLMVTPIREIDYEDFSEGIPAFLTMLIMLCASSVSDGIMFGVLFYVFAKLVSGKGRQLNIPLIAVCVLYLIKILMGAFVSA